VWHPGKGESFEPLAAALGLNVDAVFTIGEAGPEIAAAVGERATNAGDLQTAVQLAARATRGVVLLAPAAASYDQFANFEQRGEEFRRLVENLGA